MTAHPPVFAYQYFSASLFSLRFHSLKEKLGLLLKKAIISVYYFLKLRNFNLRKSESGCNRSLARL
jgi:hypothetical protein